MNKTPEFEFITDRMILFYYSSGVEIFEALELSVVHIFHLSVGFIVMIYVFFFQTFSKAKITGKKIPSL